MWFILRELQAGKFVWRTYKEFKLYDDVILIGIVIRHVGTQPVSFCSLVSFMCILFKKYLM
jgi:hypothetical protein